MASEPHARTGVPGSRAGGRSLAPTLAGGRHPRHRNPTVGQL